MSRLLQPKAFTPSREDPAALDRRTVGRADEIARLVDSFKQAATSKTRQHTILIGPRGAGKSHLVEVALHRLVDDSSLVDLFCIARVPEDAVGIVSAADVLIAVLNSLPAVSAELQNNARIARREKRLVDIESIIASVVGDRVLVLVIENLDRVFAALGESGQGDLRAWVEGTANVLILAAAPQLFRGVISRELPWFGSFRFEHLEPLSVEEGTELIRRLAADAGDDALAAFLTTDRANDRLRTIHHLAGGSPRIWTIFASSLSIESLEALVPAVEDLFEQLVPYYQQRLWDLSPIEQKILNALTLETATATVSDLAAMTGLDPAVTTTTLRRLEDTNWVQSSKIAGTDQRTSWYEVREPLLRHHYQYRNNQRDELRLIVDLLHSWFSDGDRRQWLLQAPSSSLRESYLARTLSYDPSRFDAAYANSNIEELQTTARIWAAGDGDGIGTPFVGAVIDALVTGLLESPEAARTSLARRKLPATALQILNAGLSAFSNNKDRAAVAASILMGKALDRSAAADLKQKHPSLELLAACWNGGANPEGAHQRMRKLATSSALGTRLRLAVEVEAACMLGESGNIKDAAELLGNILNGNHTSRATDLFAIRTSHALLLGESGQSTTALRLLEELVQDRTKVLGADHPDTLASRSSYAYWLAESGHMARAIELFEELICDRTRVLGANHPGTLTSRNNHAFRVGESGQAARAVELFETIIRDQTLSLGANHPDTLTARHNYVFFLPGQSPDVIEQHEKLIQDQTKALGANHPLTLATRNNLLLRFSDPDQTAQVIKGYAQLLHERTTAFGINHRDTLTTRNNLALRLGKSGRTDEAIKLFEDLIHDRTVVLGANHPDTLASRSSLASLLREAGQIVKATELCRELVRDQTVVLGVNHPNTLMTRYNYAYGLCELGQVPMAIELLQQLVRERPQDAGARQSGLVEGEPLEKNSAPELLLARLQRLQGLVKPTKSLPADGQSVRELLRRIGFERDVTAFAALPQELRSVLESPL